MSTQLHGLADARDMAERVAPFAAFFARLQDDEPPSIGGIDLSPYRAETAQTAAKRAGYLALGPRTGPRHSHEEERALAIMARHHGGELDDPAA